MRSLLQLFVALFALGCSSCSEKGTKDSKKDLVPSAETPRPANARWQYLEDMLEAECTCPDMLCSDKVYERAEKDGHRYLPAQLLEEDKRRFLGLVSQPVSCVARTGPDLQARASQDLAKMQLARIINGSYARWASATREICPESFSDLDPYRSDKSIVDPWGNDLLMLCGDNAPLDASGGFGILSLGPDGKRGSADDIRVP